MKRSTYQPRVLRTQSTAPLGAHRKITSRKTFLALALVLVVSGAGVTGWRVGAQTPHSPLSQRLVAWAQQGAVALHALPGGKSRVELLAAPVTPWVNGQAAGVVIGQPDFITNTFVSPPSASKTGNTHGIAVDPTTGKVFVADRQNHRVLRFSSLNAALTGQAAEGVLGQANFTSGSINRGGTIAQNSLSSPQGLAVDSSGRLWVADNQNSRVLRFDSAATKADGANADGVLGQPNFTTVPPVSTPGAATASLTTQVNDVEVDTSGRLWVADPFFHRVLRFDNAASKANGAAADGVLGQANFTAVASGLTQSNMNLPGSLALDASGRLWVADTSNNRVLRFDSAATKANGANADGVLGQANFVSGFANRGGTAAQNSMSSPGGVEVDAAGRLYVGDTSNNRVLIFANAATQADGANAANVLGQTTFTSSTGTTTQTGLASPRHLFFHEATQTLFVSDRNNRRTLRYSVAATTYADPTAVELTALCGANKPCYSRVQVALNLTQPGGTNNVAAGSYSDNPTLFNSVNVSLQGDATFSGALTLSSGYLNTGANTLTIACTGTVTGGSTSSFILGSLKKEFCATGSFNYQLGTSANGNEYSPLNVTITALAANPSSLTVKANYGTATASPALSDATTLDRYWTLTEGGDLTANLVFSYLQTDVDGTESSYVIKRISGGAVSQFANACPSAPCVDTTNNTATINGVTGFSDWTLGEPGSTNAPPTITACPMNQTVNASAGQCTASVNFTVTATGTPAPTITCKIGTTTTITSPYNFPVGTSNVVCTASNGTSPDATCSFSVTANDTQTPTITAPANVSANADAGSCVATGVNLGVPLTSDNCNVAVTNNAPASFPVGQTTVTWTVTDLGGNQATATQIVTVTDNQNPTITAPGTVAVNADAGSCAATGVSLGTPTTGDNCSVASVTNNAPSSFPVGTTIVTWTVKDVNNNTATATQTVIVTDNQKPTINAPAAVNASTGAGATACGVVVSEAALGSAMASDNCGTANITRSGVPAGNLFPVGTTTITYTADDGHGNTASATQTVTVGDDTAPTITAPPAVSVNANAGSCVATGVSLGTPTTGDNCGVASVTNDAPSSFPLGATTVTWTVTDVNGNTAMATQTVTVTDNQKPSISAPANVSASTGAGATSCGAVVSDAALGTPTANDNCGSVTSTRSGVPAGNFFPLGTTTITYTADDGHGNTATATQQVTVLDKTPPVMACPSNVSVAGNILGACGANVSVTAPAASDNCAGVTVAGVRGDGQALNAPYPLGTTTITWTATDAAGNQSTCLQSVTVTNPAPVATITGPATGSVYSVGTPVSFTGSFTDNAGGTHTATWKFDALTQAGTVNEATGAITGSFTFTAAGVYKVTLTVADGCGGSHTTDVIGPDGLTELVVIYDASAGWVTGGGWINSPAGAYVANPSLTGKANFGFVSKYQNGATVPTGNTEFQFKAGNLNFSSTAYEWMVIAGARAQYKGSGTINSAGDYRFMLTVIDGDQPGGGDADKFRIRIWNNVGGGLVYDNQMNAPDSADPITAIQGGQIQIKKN